MIYIQCKYTFHIKKKLIKINLVSLKMIFFYKQVCSCWTLLISVKEDLYLTTVLGLIHRKIIG